MRLLADESVDAPIVTRLRSDGHRVDYVAEMAPGLSDDVVLDHASRGGAILLTADKDFGELVFRLGKATHGMVLSRLAGLSSIAKSQIISDALRIHGQEMPMAFTVITPAAVRIRNQR